MKKKPPPGTCLIVPNPSPSIELPNTHSIPASELYFYARSFHSAAKTLAGTLDLDSGPFANFDIFPVVYMYRHALELHLKALVLGDGANFLATRPDSISVSKTHSVSWLAQFVCQIVTAVKWKDEFKCEGIETLADFKEVVEGLNAVDPGFYAFRLPFATETQGSDSSGLIFTVREFARRMNALLELLDSTADALAATWDLQNEGLDLEG